MLRRPLRPLAPLGLAIAALASTGCGDCWGSAPTKPSSASRPTAAAPAPLPPSQDGGVAVPPGAPAAPPGTPPGPPPPRAPSPRAEVPMAQVGDPFPSVRVRDQHGKERSLDEFRGRRVVLWWFPKADTPGWTIEGCGFRDLQDEYAKKQTVLLGASFDTPAENLAFATKQQYRFDILCDTDRALGRALGLATDEKTPYAKRWTFVVGPTGVIEQRIEKVDPRSHPAELLQSLD